MNILYFMIPIAVAMGALFVYFFIWATRDGQFDDLDTPAVRLLVEDSIEDQKNNSKHINLEEIGKDYE